MKKTIIVFLLLTLVFAGCSSKESKNVWKQGKASVEIEPYASRAIEIIDGYLSFELTADEATKEFEALYQRIKPYDIRGINSTYSDPDMTISYIVDLLAIFEADERTDVEYHQYRDILSFQIGEAVSGKSYTASRSGLDNCPQMQAMLKIENLPFDFAFEHQFDDSWLWSLTFDEMNGVSQTDFCGYIETIIQSVINNSIKNATLSFYYNRYEQSVFSISIHIVDGELKGSVKRSGEDTLKAYEQLIEEYTPEDISAIEKYPVKYDILNPLFEFTDLDQLPEAVKTGFSYAGIE